MKKYDKIPALLLFLFLVGSILYLLFYFYPKEYVQVPALPKQVDAISIYPSSESWLPEKKVVESEEDISAIIQAVAQAYYTGSYEDIPDGGVVFNILFHLSDGTLLPCCYYQTGGSSGYYTDGAIRMHISGLDFEGIWESLDCESIRVSVEDEFSGWPSLQRD